MKKRVLSFVLVLILVFSLIPVATAENMSKMQSDGLLLTAIASPETGSIPISNREELQKIGKDRTYPLNGKYYLTADIDLSGMAWVPIGKGYTFNGTFDGQGHIIRGLTVISAVGAAQEYYAGLFGRASTDAVIKNVGLDASNISVKGSGHIYAGGICGYGGDISNCYNSGTISATSLGSPHKAYSGGVVGINGTVSNCYYIGSVSAFSSGGDFSTFARAYAGGISGFNNEGFSVSNCYSTASVTADTLLSDFTGYDSRYICSYAGGIVGYGEDGSSYWNTYWNIDCEQKTIVRKQLNALVLSDEKKGLGYGVGQATGLTTDQMKLQPSFSGWDFSATWGFKAGENNGYPVLLAFYPVQASTPIPAPAASANPIDSASSWARDGITSAVSKGFVPSDLQSNYTNVITRAEFCRMAVKWVEYKTGKSIDSVLAEKGVSRNPNAFSDTKDEYILAAYALGITSGTGDGKFAPNGQFNREQAAGMIRNTCRAAGMNVSNVTASGFADIGSASSWAVDGINFVSNAGIMTGTGGGNFSPKATYTREQSIVMFNNIK